MNGGLKFLFYYSMFNIIGFMIFMGTQGKYEWVIEYIIILFMLMGYFKFLQKIPIVKYIDDNAEKLRQFYLDNPEYLSVKMIIIRFIPVINYFYLWREIRLVLWLFIITVPFNIAIDIIIEFTSSFPSLAFLSNGNFWSVAITDTYYSVFITPYLAFLTLGVKMKQKDMAGNNKIQNNSSPEKIQQN